MPRQSSALFFAFLLLFPFPAIAQIIPDNSLGAESSRTVPDTINNLPSDRITGGATRGANLFHSLQQFNVGEGRGAYFANPNGIANIFTRVTGGNPSNILGVLGVLGNANLFLLNPKGIVFGPNARLDVRGSFIGSTASGIFFDNGFEFSSANPSAVPLLAINIPVGLNFRENPGTIVNTSQAIGSTPTLPPLPVEIPVSNKLGLAVDPGQTLALIGGEIQLQGGNLTAYTGQILLGSVKSPGLVQFEPTALGLNLNYGNIENFGNIEMNGAFINTSGLEGGRIDIRGGNVTLNGSRILALTLGNINGRGIDINAQQLRVNRGSQISTVALGDGAAGNINIRATDSVEMSGIGFESYQQFLQNYLRSGTGNPLDPQIVLSTATLGRGVAGAIAIDTGRLLIRNGSLVGSSTFASGNGGNITIRAEVFDLAGSAINSGTFVGSTGIGGNITFEGERLIVRDGAAISSVTRSRAASGNINIKANESLEILRTPAGSVLQTIISTTALGQNGNAGNITINTKKLTISGGAGINSSSGAAIGTQLLNTTGGLGGNVTIRASESIEIGGVSEILANGRRSISFIASDTYSSNRGGDIYISTPVLLLRSGGFISAGSFGTADAANVTIDAQKVELIGNGNPGEFSSAIQASVGFLYQLRNPNARANAGSLNFNVNQLRLRDSATVNVQALGTGQAGNINVRADSIALENKASINASTDSGGGGNVNIRAPDIQLRRGSRITTDASISEGGNINIKSDILVALPNENSDITANARSAGGGRVNINVPNVFGFTSVTREQVRASLGLTDAQFGALQVSPTSLVPTSDIAAISQSSGPALQGTVTFSSSGVNPAQGLVELPQNVVDPAALIAANPCTQEAESEFTATGKGGVPASPNDALSSAASPFPWVEEAGRGNQEEGIEIEGGSGSREEGIRQEEVVPAQGWVVNAKGEVTLVGYNPGNVADSRNPRQNSGCVPR
ncbi:filamentous hemagglutinin N-terminal domain-containing protein [Microcoleus vaginatus PCC 9802]|uniref:two-partner secretion domain-containing protein n=1 Tax=Microcoleus vaginatus TaxID=119532 RepID=UPI00020D282F|nr:filamentous hemagglutinin family outer membrane protein [Microcoleus vaginatus FGP-2]UNU21848.1 filamentous hemagglutinin N-terminal domain-containing protein [Microcoleus vaginatus PCC 9802]